MTIKEIKSCPWCGCMPQLIQEPLWHGSHGYYGIYEYHYRCSNCGAQPPGGYSTTFRMTDAEAQEMALKAWNRRI